VAVSQSVDDGLPPRTHFCRLEPCVDWLLLSCIMQVAVVKEAGVAGQQVWYSLLSKVQEDTAAGAPLSPCVIIVGQVAALPAVWHR